MFLDSVTQANASFLGEDSSMASRPYFLSTGNATKRIVDDTTIHIENITISNPNTVSLFLQMFDAAATGDVTLGSTAPNYVLPIPDGTSATLVGAIDKEFPKGLQFDLGFVWAITTTATGSTGAASDCVLSASYNS